MSVMILQALKFELIILRKKVCQLSLVFVTSPLVVEDCRVALAFIIAAIRICNRFLHCLRLVANFGRFEKSLKADSVVTISFDVL